MAVTPDHVPALAPPAEPARPRVLLVGTALAAAATTMLFVGLIGTYVVLRAEVIATGERWLPAGVEIPLSSPNMAMVTLLMSVVTMHWALAALGNADRRNAFVALGLSILLAAAFVNSTIFLYTQMQLGIADGLQAVLIYGITGAHVALIVVAAAFAVIVTFRALGGEYVPGDREGVAAAVLFWDVSVAIFAIIWYVIYITK